MNETVESLASLGMTTTEAAIYLSGLKKDALSIEDIGKETRIKRPTIYHAIGTLKKKGLVAEKYVSGKLRFTMCRPEHLRSLIEEQRELISERAHKLEELIPMLASITPSGEQTSVVHHNGIDGMKLVMDIAFYCKSKRWDVIAPIHNFLREYDKAYADRYLRARKHYGITSRALWENSMRDGKPLTKDEIRDRNPRYMPKNMQGKFKSMLFLFDDKIAIFSSYDTLSAILITSKEIHDMFQAMFDGLWDVSTPPIPN